MNLGAGSWYASIALMARSIPLPLSSQMFNRLISEANFSFLDKYASIKRSGVTKGIPGFEISILSLKISTIGKPFSEYRKSVEMPKDKNGQNKFAYNSSLELMDINNEFEFNVNFENLTDEELGVLIYAIELEDGLLHKIGKGKAFGFGSCKIEIKEFLLENKDKYKDFLIEPFEKESKKEDYINKAKEKRYFDENRKNIKELKAILSKTNDLDFSESPFPEDTNKKGEKNTLNWFVNNKRGDRKIVLLSILDKNPK